MSRVQASYSVLLTELVTTWCILYVYVREYTYTVQCIVYSIHVYCIHCKLTRLLYTVQDMYTVQSNIDRYLGNMSSLLFWGVNLGVNVHTVENDNAKV